MKKILFLFLTGVFVSCQTNSQQENKLEQLDKSSAREVVLTSQENGDTIYHITKQKIWANQSLVGEKTDTLKTLKAWNDSVKVPIYVTIQ